MTDFNRYLAQSLTLVGSVAEAKDKVVPNPCGQNDWNRSLIHCYSLLVIAIHADSEQEWQFFTTSNSTCGLETSSESSSLPSRMRIDSVSTCVKGTLQSSSNNMQQYHCTNMVANTFNGYEHIRNKATVLSLDDLLNHEVRGGALSSIIIALFALMKHCHPLLSLVNHNYPILFIIRHW